MSRVFEFTRALVRSPGASVERGLRAVDRGAPTREGIQSELHAYVRALTDAGVEVETLPPLEAFPDSIFVEDTALVFPEGAIVLRPGAPTRRGEVGHIAPELRRRFDRVLDLTSGFAEGGDVLTTSRTVMIGLSARTDETGARALSGLLARLGRSATIVNTPDDVLHFKTDCSLLDEDTVLCTPGLAAASVFEGYRVILTPAGEEGAANAVRVNGSVLLGADFPRTAETLTSAGYRVVALPRRQIALLDAGFSCLSLRWSSAS